MMMAVQDKEDDDNDNVLDGRQLHMRVGAVPITSV